MKELLESTRPDRRLLITDVSHRRRDLVIRLEVFPEPTDGSVAAWMVTCRQVCQCSFTDFDGGGVNWWTNEHPVLSQFSSPKASLRVTLGPRTRSECVGLLLCAHWKLVGDWIDFLTFAPAGLLTETPNASIVFTAPEFLLEAYHRDLIAAGFRSSLKPHKRRLYWSGYGWSQRRREVSLLHIGASFIVAGSFVASPDTSERARTAT